MFFSQMNHVMDVGVDYNLTLSKNEKGMTVLVMPRMNDLKDGAQHHLAPFTPSGAPEELDRHFMAAVEQPVQRAAGLLTSMAQFERQAEKAADESKASKEQKDKESKEAKEKREKYEKFVKKSEEQEAARDYAGAIESLRQARLHSTAQSAKSVDEKIAALRAKANEGTLFGAPAQEPVPQSPRSQMDVSIPARTDGQPQPALFEGGTYPQHRMQQPQQPMQTPSGPAWGQPQGGSYNGQPTSVQQERQAAYADPFEHISSAAASGAEATAFRNAIPGGTPHNCNTEQPAARQQYVREHPAMDFTMSTDGSACREDEYSGYPDFPREMNNKPMYDNLKTF